MGFGRCGGPVKGVGSWERGPEAGPWCSSGLCGEVESGLDSDDARSLRAKGPHVHAHTGCVGTTGQGRSGPPSHEGEALTGTWAQARGRGAPAAVDGAAPAGRDWPRAAHALVCSSLALCQPRAPRTPISMSWLWWRSGCSGLHGARTGSVTRRVCHTRTMTQKGRPSQDSRGGSNGKTGGSIQFWGPDAPQLGMLLRRPVLQPEPQTVTLTPRQCLQEAPPLPDVRDAAGPLPWSQAP